MALKLSNNASGLLAIAINNSATSLTLQSGQGSRFPALGAGDWFPITVVQATNPAQFEIMSCTARSGDTLTVVRAQEGTSGLSFNPGDVVEIRMTEGTLFENFPQVDNGNARNLRFSVQNVSGRAQLTYQGPSPADPEIVLRQSDVTTSAADTTSGRLTKVGDFGLGRLTQNTTNGIDLDDANLPVGFYSGNSWQNTPLGNLASNQWGYLLVENLASNYPNYIKQTFTANNNSDVQIWVRVRQSGTWGSWVKLYHNENLTKSTLGLGSVENYPIASQSEAETGSANNRYMTPLRTAQAITQAITQSLNQYSQQVIGIGQTWQDVTASRAKNITYQNTTGKPIYVAIVLEDAGAGAMYAYVNSVVVGGVGFASSADISTLSFIVPAGSLYALNDSPGARILYWAELR